MPSLGTDAEKVERRRLFLEKVRRAAARAIAEEDVWRKYDIPSIPAERVVRHFYNHETRKWNKDETVAKMEKEPFTKGAMRHCYRMKMRATPPQSASNHRFHSYGWSRALNYVAKAYLDDDGNISTSEETKHAVMNDIILQYEAAHWADSFNDYDPPKKINFIRAYAVEFPNREGQPIFAVERFIAGRDTYGAGFVKHNTNSGFVDLDLRRITPQVFSAFSFYASRGTRLVADIQGVGDLFTDPQVHSIDYRFGEGDLGPRGMALFFKSFRHSSFSDSFGIPIFQLSRNERKRQAKYDDDEVTLSDDESYVEEEVDEDLSKLLRIDQNRQRRKSILVEPLGGSKNMEKMDTLRRSNLTVMRQEVSSSIKKSFARYSSIKPSLKRTQSDVDEVTSCLQLATTDYVFDHRSFHRKASGELRRRTSAESENGHKVRRHTIMHKVLNPMMPTEETRANLGKVHYHLACLHGLGRFPEIVPTEVTGSHEVPPSHDVSSVVFHICHAASLRNVSACLSLARVKTGLDTTVSDLLKTVIPVDFDGAKDLLYRAMENENPPSGPKAAAGCLLLQIMENEDNASDACFVNVLEQTLELMAKAEKEAKEMAADKDRQDAGCGFQPGDRVEANFALEGTFYPAIVTEVLDNENIITVQYDDDDSFESLPADNVKAVGTACDIPAGETGPKSDAEVMGGENMDEKCLFEIYTLKAHLAELKAKIGLTSEAAALYEEAADGAMNDGKMQTATTWSLCASELQG